MAEEIFGEEAAQEVESKRQRSGHQSPGEVSQEFPSPKNGIRILKRKNELYMSPVRIVHTFSIQEDLLALHSFYIDICRGMGRRKLNPDEIKPRSTSLKSGTRICKERKKHLHYLKS